MVLERILYAQICLQSHVKGSREIGVISNSLVIFLIKPFTEVKLDTVVQRNVDQRCPQYFWDLQLRQKDRSSSLNSSREHGTGFI